CLLLCLSMLRLLPRPTLFPYTTLFRSPADGVPGPGLSRILPIHQCRALGGAVDDPVADHQHPVEHLHQELAAAARARPWPRVRRSEEHTSELQSPCNLVCRLLLEKKNY